MSIIKKHILPISFIAIALAIAFPTLRYYVNFQLAGVGLAILPFIINIESPGQFSYRFGWIAFAFFILNIFLPSPLIILFTFYFFIFQVIEIYFGKISLLAPTLVILTSPLAHYSFEIFSFPIRLTLTKQAANILQLAGYQNIISEGNRISIDDHLFSVDPECMGLNMVLTSFLAAIILVRIDTFRQKRQWKIGQFSFILVITFLLAILSNLVRIIGLVITQAPPEAPLHEWIGLGSMALFVLLPLYFLTDRIGKNLHQPIIKNLKTTQPKFSRLILSILTVGLFLTQVTNTYRSEVPLDQETLSFHIPNYEKDIYTFNKTMEVLRFTSDKSIVYYKKQNPFRLTNHSPLFCWRGSGYEFKNERLLEVGNHQINTATLVKNHEILYTAWWYDNGLNKSGNNINWRWHTIKSQESCHMINVTCGDFSSLYMEVEKLINP